jgi:hypothetical protein
MGYFKGDPVDNEKRLKDGWKSLSRYITIETGVRPKKECVYTSGKPMRHRMVHTLLLCNDSCWNELEYVKNRRGESDSVNMYKSQDGRPLDY